MVELKSGTKIPYVRSLEFARQTGLRHGLYPGLEGISVRYNVYMEHVIAKGKSVEIEIPGNVRAKHAAMQSRTVAEMDQDHVIICWSPDWYPTSPYVLEHCLWKDRGYKRLALVDDPKI